MRLRKSALILCLCVSALSQDRRSVRDVTGFVRSAIQLKQPDGDVARALHKLALTGSMDDRTILQLQSEGAGPKTVAELRRLMEAARALPKPDAPAASAKAAAPPSPPAGEQKRLIETARETALHYTEGLPDFLCTQAIRRYVDTGGKESWRLMDRLVVRLGYAERREDYKLISVNDRPADKDYQAIAGTTSSGEFGSMLHEIFAPESHARFQRERETSQVLKFVLEADNVPPDSPVQRALTTVDYDFAEVGGKPYLLPLRADLRLAAGERTTRNDVQFVNYRKFSADATLSFDTPAPLPDDKSREKKPLR